MFFVYVLQSPLTGQHYTDFTSDLTQRIGQHNEGFTKSTKGRGPRTLIYHEQHRTRSEAMRREKYFKSGKAPKSCIVLSPFQNQTAG